MTAPGHVIVTGGSSGIGKAVAKLYAGDGNNVTIIAGRPDVLKAARQEIGRARGAACGETHVRTADVADRDALTAAIGGAIDKTGAPTVLVTSAGVVVPGYFADLPMSVFEEHMAVNCFGSLYAIAAVLPARARKAGRAWVTVGRLHRCDRHAGSQVATSTAITKGLSARSSRETSRLILPLAFSTPPFCQLAQASQK